MMLMVRRRVGRLGICLWAVLALIHQPVGAEVSLARPGELVSVGTHRLHLYCTGDGAPTVVVDTGLGSISLEWFKFQKIVAQWNRTCVYDRAGYGWSEPGPGPRTASRNADELYLLLTHADIPAPYVLVGHSYGGYNVQIFANRYPFVTAGLVLVESSHAEQVERFRAPPINMNTAPSGKFKQVRFASHIDVPRNLPVKVRNTIINMHSWRQMRKAVADEYLNFRQSALEVHSTGPLPKVPVVVLTRGKRQWPRTRRGDLIEDLWQDLQNELAEQSPYSAHLIAETSGHQIHIDQPELIADAVSLILDVVDASAPGMEPPPHPRTKPAFTNASWRSDSLRRQIMPGLIYPVRLSSSDYYAMNYAAAARRFDFQPVRYVRQ